MSDLKTLFERDPFNLNTVDDDEQRVAKFWAMRKAEQQARREAPQRREQERADKAAAKLAKAAERERLKTEIAAAKAAAKAAKAATKAAKLKPDPRQIDLEDLIDELRIPPNADSAAGRYRHRSETMNKAKVKSDDTAYPGPTQKEIIADVKHIMKAQEERDRQQVKLTCTFPSSSDEWRDLEARIRIAVTRIFEHETNAEASGWVALVLLWVALDKIRAADPYHPERLWHLLTMIFELDEKALVAMEKTILGFAFDQVNQLPEGYYRTYGVEMPKRVAETLARREQESTDRERRYKDQDAKIAKARKKLADAEAELERVSA